MADKLRDAAQQLPPFDDIRVQAVYKILTDDEMPEDKSEHWEGYQARRIVAALAQQDEQAATCKQDLQVDVLLDEMLEAAPAVAQGESLGAKALRLADAIDPFTRKAPLDHLTSTVAAQTLRALAVAQVPQGWKLVPVAPTPEMKDVQTWDYGAFRPASEIWADMLNAAPTPPAPKPLGWLDREAVECLRGAELNWMPAWNRPTSSDPVPVFLGQPAQRVMLTDEEITALPVWAHFVGLIADSKSDIARAVIEAYERKNGIK